MFGLGAVELSLIFGIVLVLFGAKRLPAIATGLGTAIKNFKTSVSDDKSNDNDKFLDKK